MGSGGIGGVSAGLPELILLFGAVVWIVLIGASLWVVFTLHRLRRSVERIEQLLRAKTTP